MGDVWLASFLSFLCVWFDCSRDEVSFVWQKNILEHILNNIMTVGEGDCLNSLLEAFLLQCPQQIRLQMFVWKGKSYLEINWKTRFGADTICTSTNPVELPACHHQPSFSHAQSSSSCLPQDGGALPLQQCPRRDFLDELLPALLWRARLRQMLERNGTQRSFGYL